MMGYFNICHVRFFPHLSQSVDPDSTSKVAYVFMERCLFDLYSLKEKRPELESNYNSNETNYQAYELMELQVYLHY
jgi:hypothetical protein